MSEQQHHQFQPAIPVQKKRPHQTSSKWNLENALLELNWDSCETISIKEPQMNDRLFDALCRCQSLRELYWCSIPLNLDTITRLARVLEVNPRITYLSLYGAKIGDECCRVLAGALKKNSTLNSLSLQNNAVGAIGATALAEALEINTALRELNLSDNWLMRDEGAKAIGRMFLKNRCLEMLNVSNCGFKSDGMKSMVLALDTNNVLKKLSTKKSVFDAEVLGLLRDFLDRRPWFQLSIDAALDRRSPERVESTNYDSIAQTVSPTATSPSNSASVHLVSSHHSTNSALQRLAEQSIPTAIFDKNSASLSALLNEAVLENKIHVPRSPQNQVHSPPETNKRKRIPKGDEEYSVRPTSSTSKRSKREEKEHHHNDNAHYMALHQQQLQQQLQQQYLAQAQQHQQQMFLLQQQQAAAQAQAQLQAQQQQQQQSSAGLSLPPLGSNLPHSFSRYLFPNQQSTTAQNQTTQTTQTQSTSTPHTPQSTSSSAVQPTTSVATIPDFSSIPSLANSQRTPSQDLSETVKSLTEHVTILRAGFSEESQRTRSYVDGRFHQVETRQDELLRAVHEQNQTLHREVEFLKQQLIEITKRLPPPATIPAQNP